MGERSLWGVVGDAVADIRSKLIDEGWFGRRVGERPGGGMGQGWEGPTIHDTPRDLPRGPSFEEAWAVREPAELQGRGPEPGLDR
ncbi:hypothetical protein [Brevundimonas sp.]|jgi:hypothetical protein|uniref:hypothetical protein n=1 Tax=Brevundimonas sp. TaxID=1871086 RepID=UPI003919879B